MISAQEAHERLREGNRSFVSNSVNLDSPRNEKRPADLAGGQLPFATIVGCSDSRVPPEVVFTQGLGDLFVIRVAGNIITPAQIGSVEFAAMEFGTPLVVVLGHSRCGAVLATLEAIQDQQEIESHNLRSIVDRVRPSVEKMLKTKIGDDSEAVVREAVRANIHASVNDLRHGSELLQQMIQNEDLVVVGAEYSLETGIVEFFDDEMVS